MWLKASTWMWKVCESDCDVTLIEIESVTV